MLMLGNVKFRVKDFKGEFTQKNIEELKEEDPKEQELMKHGLKEAKLAIANQEEEKKESEIEGQDQHACRCCWKSDSTEENPCIAPCKCKGSVGNVHLDWLRTGLPRNSNSSRVRTM